VDTVNLAKNNGYEAIGLAMHVLADTWAHTYFAGTPSLVINNTNSYFYELMPQEDGSFKRRPVEFGHNPAAKEDPEKGEYLTASTKPIPVTVKSARKITLNDASFADAKPADDGALREEATEIKAAEAGRAPDRPLQELLKNHISPLDDGRSYAMYFAIPAALWLLLLAARFLPSLAAASPAKRRAKAAAAKCLAALDSFKPENFSAMEELNGAFQELMGAKFNMTPGTITYQDIARKAKHLPPHQLETIRKFLELCENARYAGNAVSLADIDSDLRRLIREL
jgi:hypothetical protein